MDARAHRRSRSCSASQDELPGADQRLLELMELESASATAWRSSGGGPRRREARSGCRRACWPTSTSRRAWDWRGSGRSARARELLTRGLAHSRDPPAQRLVFPVRAGPREPATTCEIPRARAATHPGLERARRPSRRWRSGSANTPLRRPSCWLPGPRTTASAGRTGRSRRCGCRRRRSGAASVSEASASHLVVVRDMVIPFQLSGAVQG